MHHLFIENKHPDSRSCGLVRHLENPVERCMHGKGLVCTWTIFGHLHRGVVLPYHWHRIFMLCLNFLEDWHFYRCGPTLCFVCVLFGTVTAHGFWHLIDILH